MRKLFVPQEKISANEITITDKDDIHHLKDVVRKKCGDILAISDGYDNEYEGAIIVLEKDKIVVGINKKRNIKPAKKTLITLACAIPKKSKFDTIIEKTTELGVDRIIPLITERSVVKIQDQDSTRKLLRWQRIAKEASKQSGSSRLPIIGAIETFKQLKSHFSDFDYILIPNLNTKSSISLIASLRHFEGKNKILVLIGPEGDFTPEEVKEALAAKALPISLGKRVLKVETAAIICIGLLSLFLTKE